MVKRYKKLTHLVKLGESGKLKDKNIICPFDLIITNNGVLGVTINFKEEGILATANSVELLLEHRFPNMWETIYRFPVDLSLKEDRLEYCFRNKLRSEAIRTLILNARKWGVKSLALTAYDPNEDRGIDYRHINYSKYDLCITEPPKHLVERADKFISDRTETIVLVNMNNEDSD